MRILERAYRVHSDAGVTRRGALRVLDRYGPRAARGDGGATGSLGRAAHLSAVEPERGSAKHRRHLPASFALPAFRASDSVAVE